MSDTWIRTGPVASGGTVLSVSQGADGQTWLATGGGVLCDADGHWAPLPDRVPMEQVGLAAAAGPDRWLAGLSEGLILTWDGGHSWATPWIDQVSGPITCMVASPTYDRDITLLAGTAGAGVLRSTDGGRRWRLSNFGLEEFSIFALAAAGDWSRRQVVFAGTADGIYRTSGGGRAWKSVGLKGLAVQALACGHRPLTQSPGEAAVSGLPDASGAWAVLAGTEANGLHRALDGGYTWEQCGWELGADAGINALLSVDTESGECWLTATDDGSIWRSTDNGGAWTPVLEAGGPVLVLAEGHGVLLAGTSEQGLWASTDGGLTWRRDDSLCARGFRRLERAGKTGLAALAPTGGVWLSTDAGATWDRAVEASLYEPVLTHLSLEKGWLSARAEGLWRGGPGAEPSLVLAAENAPIVVLAGGERRGPGMVSGGALWAGAADGALWASQDGGDHWQAVDVPFAGQRLLDLALSPADGTPLAGTFAHSGNVLTLWRYDGEHWHSWLSRSDTWPGLALCPCGARAEESWAALGGKPYAHSANGWQKVEVPGHEGGIAVITDAPPGGARYLIAEGEVLCHDAAGAWRSLPLPKGATTPIDLCLLPSGRLFCLDAAGVVWRLAD